MFPAEALVLRFAAASLVLVGIGVVAAACTSPADSKGTSITPLTPDAAAVARPNAGMTQDEAASRCVGLPLPDGVVPGSVPPYAPGAAFAGEVAAALDRYHELGISYEEGLARYSATGDFLNFGRNSRYEADPSLQWDDRGVPMVEYGGEFYYNPVTVSQYALTLYGRHVRGEATTGQFLAVADALAGLQDERGAFPAAYPYTYYITGEVFEPGWVSGMSQGQALSVFRRAFEVSGDERYLDAGTAALSYLTTSRANGGPMDTLYYLAPELDDFITFEEFDSAVPFYTLNGFVFTLLGVYDWSTLDPAVAGESSATAARFFDCGLATVLYTLPYYDVDGMSAYDLGHVLADRPANVQAEYHAIHIQLLDALYSIEPLPGLAEWRDAWIADVASRPVP